MSIKDVIKKSFLQGFNSSEITLKSMLFCLAIAALLGIFIFFVYRIMMFNSFYSPAFNLSLMLLCVTTTAIILTIQNSVIVSLGMVGALSIVRFRTAVKEPLDLVFLFWSISAGIISGTGMIGLAIALSVIITVLMLVFSHLPEQRKSKILSVNASGYDKAEEILQVVKKFDKHCHEKSRNMSQGQVDLLLEVRLKNYDSLIQEVNALEGIIAVSLIEHRGDVLY